MEPLVFHDDCTRFLADNAKEVPPFDFTFLDPPFNQGKEYREHDDRLDEGEYWDWMREVCQLTLDRSSEGAAMYFMQREKNAENVLRVLRESGWQLPESDCVAQENIGNSQPSAIWQGVSGHRFRHERTARQGIQPIADKPARAGNGYKPRETRHVRHRCLGRHMDRELTSGYYAGDELALRHSHDGERIHKQQSPVALLLRMILSSTNPGDCAFDPFAGTGTTLVVASQLSRVGCRSAEKDAVN